MKSKFVVGFRVGLVLVLTTVWCPVAVAQDGDVLKAQLVELEQAAWQAWKDGDAGFFENYMLDDARLILGDGSNLSKADLLEQLKAGSCEVAGYELTGFSLHRFGAATAALTYTASQDAVCNGQAVPPRLVVSSLYVLRDGSWQGALYQETVPLG